MLIRNGFRWHHLNRQAEAVKLWPHLGRVTNDDPHQFSRIDHAARGGVELGPGEARKACGERLVIIVRPPQQVVGLHRAEHRAGGFEAAGELPRGAGEDAIYALIARAAS